ncbi:MAG TPA: ferritin-like domain-containing protein [Candidatus Kapabacteria bacterium]|nr:ferritin-like domain-containing protein [Candidatus Kapabacteria bacterium]
MDTPNSRRDLVGILKLAYSGERAAAYAYRGHAKTATDPEERDRIRAIEEEEWHHRSLVGEMLAALGERPSAAREARGAIMGRTLGLLCFLSGWFLPMYAAGRLESRNIKEYEAAARHARAGGHGELTDSLLEMAEVEWDHEAYFRSRIILHPWVRWFPLWQSPPPRETIRSSFSGEHGEPGNSDGA